MSPEIFSGSSFYGPASDLWSAGIILFLWVTGMAPWYVPCSSDQRFQWIVEKRRLSELLASWPLNPPLSNSLLAVLQALLVLEKDRVTIRQLYEMTWIREAVERRNKDREKQLQQRQQGSSSISSSSTAAAAPVSHAGQVPLAPREEKQQYHP